MKDGILSEIVSRKREAATIPGTTITFTTIDYLQIMSDMKLTRINWHNSAQKFYKICIKWYCRNKRSVVKNNFRSIIYFLFYHIYCMYILFILLFDIMIFVAIQCHSKNENFALNIRSEHTFWQLICWLQSSPVSLESNEPSLILISKPFIHCLQQAQEFNVRMIFSIVKLLPNFLSTSKNSNKSFIYQWHHAFLFLHISNIIYMDWKIPIIVSI